MTGMERNTGRVLGVAIAMLAGVLASCGGTTITVTPGASSPTVSITGIDQNELIYNDRRISVVANDSDGSITRLRVWLDGELIFTDTYYRPQVIEEFDLYGDRASAGRHTVEVVATDDDGYTDRDVVDYRVAY